MAIAAACAIAVGFATLVRDASVASRIGASRNNLQHVMLGIENYAKAYHQLPPHAICDANDVPIHSWRTAVTPWLAAVDYLYSWDEPWDGPFNLRLAHGLDVHIDASPLNEFGEPLFKTMGPYDGPVDYAWPFRTAENVGESDFRVHYFAVVGDESAWPRNRTMTFDDIGDGVANTILLAESHTIKSYWSQPDDLVFDEMTFVINNPVGPGISSPREHGPLVAFADGEVFFVNPSTPQDVVRALITANGGETIDRSELIRDGWLR